MRIRFIVLAGIYCLLNQSISAQYTRPESQPEVFIPKLSLGGSSGINNSVGLAGASAEYRLGHRITFIGGLGLGTWGTKVSGGIRAYVNYPYKFAFGASYSVALGVTNVAVNDQTKVNGVVTSKTVNIALLPVHLINLTASYHFKIGYRCRIGLEGGYSLALNKGFNYKVIDKGASISPDLQRVLNFLEPGGVYIGFHFSYGLL